MATEQRSQHAMVLAFPQQFIPLNRVMGLALNAVDPAGNQPECDKLNEDGPANAEGVDQWHRIEPWLIQPPGQVNGTKNGTSDKKHQRHSHPHIPGTNSKQGAGATATTQLHAYTE